MIEIARSARPCVFDSSGDLLSVQLMNNARRSEKSHWLLSASSSSFTASGAFSTVDIASPYSAYFPAFEAALPGAFGAVSSARGGGPIRTCGGSERGLVRCAHCRVPHLGTAD